MINDLNRLITRRLNDIKTEYGIKEISFQTARKDAEYPHIVFSFSGITPADMGRQDFMVDVDVWSKDPFEVFQIMDAVKNVFAFRNDPQEEILPTFYEMSSGTVDDPDRTLVHGIVRLECQVYEAGATDASILRKE